MSVPEIIIPDPRIKYREEQLLKQWKEEKEASEETFHHQNVAFRHDPEWREYWLSMEAARTKRGIWLYVSWTFYAAQAAFVGGYWYSYRGR